MFEKEFYSCCGKVCHEQTLTQLCPQPGDVVALVTAPIQCMLSKPSISFQNMNISGFRACVKELYETRYDPVSVGYAVLTGQ